MTLILSIVAIAFILLSHLSSNNVYAGNLTSSSGSCGSNVTYNFDSNLGALTIKGSGNMSNYSSATLSPFYGCQNIKSISISEGVTSIGDLAFSGCNGVTRVYFPQGVKSIGDYAFNSCSGLATVSIPEGVTSIGQGAFSGCSGLTTVRIPKSVTSIGTYAFTYDYGDIYINCKAPSTVTQAFSGFRGVIHYPCNDSSWTESVRKSWYSGSWEPMHNYVTHEAKAATCTEVGWKEYKACSKCNDRLSYEEIPALRHDYVRHEAKAATCTEAGWNAYATCSRCTYTNYKEIPALGHKYVTHVAKAATCTEVGWNKYQTCSRCDYSSYKEIPALGHKYVTHEAKTPTCTEVGWNEYQTCSKCDYTSYNEIPAGHKWEESFTVDIKPTCTQDGSKSKHCKNCDAVIDNQDVPAVGHKGDWKIVNEPTCTKPGSKELVCTVCKHKTTEEIPEKGHSWNSKPTVDKAATCTEVGSQSIHCSRCSETKDVEEIFALGHSWDEDYTVDKEATCTEEGLNSIHCSKCDATKDIISIPSLGHEYAFETRKATISTNGSVTKECSVCGDKTTETIYYPKTIKLQATAYTYSGGVKKPAVSVIDANGKTITSRNYSVSYSSGRKSVGKYNVTVTFKGDKFSGSKYTYFYINPKGTSISKVTGDKNEFTVKWKKQSSKMATSTITGYQIRYSTSSKMTSAKTKTVKGYKYTSKKITKLSAKKKYYVQIRTYKTVSGKTYYSSWSGVKSVKTK